jgi:hypothetical protein
MGAETRYDLWLKRINTWIAILGGSVASLAGVYNFYPSFFPAAPGNISAVVRAHGGAPVSRVHVELLTSQNVLLGASDTDRAGRYVKKDLEPGSYMLKVSRGGFEPQVARVSVASKKTTDLELVLRTRIRSQAPATPQPATTQQSATSSQPAASPQAQASPPGQVTPQAQGSAIRSALEETGASWIRSLGNPGK